MDSPESDKAQQEKIKTFIQLLDVRSSGNMTRLYTAMSQSEMLNGYQKNTQKK